MDTENFAYMAYMVAAIVLFGLTIRIVARGRKVKVADSAILLFVLVGLMYDNFMLAFGGQILDEGDVFLWLSVPRYVMHGLFTPLLIMQVALSADRLNVPGYRSRELLTLWGEQRSSPSSSACPRRSISHSVTTTPVPSRTEPWANLARHWPRSSRCFP